MSFFDTLRPASFRGVAFEVDDHSETGGRRLVKHEYPLRDIPYTEDMGRKAGAWRIEAFVIQRRGFDVSAARDEIREALNAAGPGTLIHPWLGELEVCVDDFSLRESNREGGYCQFSISFVEAGSNEFPEGEEDTAASVHAAADAVEETAAEDFAAEVSDLAEPGLFDRLGNALSTAATILAWPGQVAARAIGLVRAVAAKPLALAQKLFSFYSYARGGSALSSFLPGSLLASLGMNLPNFSTSGKSATRRSGTAQAVQAMLYSLPLTSTEYDGGITSGGQNGIGSGSAGFTPDPVAKLAAVATTVSLCRDAADAEYETADDALSVRSELMETLDVVADYAPDVLFNRLTDLRAAVVRDLGTRGAALPRITSTVLPGTMPALVASYRIHGTAAREDEIIARNRIRHPGRVPGNTPLEVLSK